MSAAPLPVPCLTPVVGGYFQAVPGQICLTLADIVPNTDFDVQHCNVRDTSAVPSVLVQNDSLEAKKWCFTLTAGKAYNVQLVCAQLPAFGAQASLAACGVDLMIIDDSNQIQRWTVQA